LIFFPGLKNCFHGWPGIEPTTTTLDLSSQSGAYDLSATATPAMLCPLTSCLKKEMIDRL